MKTKLALSNFRSYSIGSFGLRFKEHFLARLLVCFPPDAFFFELADARVSHAILFSFTCLPSNMHVLLLTRVIPYPLRVSLLLRVFPFSCVCVFFRSFFFFSSNAFLPSHARVSLFLQRSKKILCRDNFNRVIFVSLESISLGKEKKEDKNSGKLMVNLRRR